MDTTGVALLGFGHWGRNLARNLARLGAFAPSAIRPTVARRRPQGVHGCAPSADWEKPLADPAVKAS